MNDFPIRLNNRGFDQSSTGVLSWILLGIVVICTSLTSVAFAQDNKSSTSSDSTSTILKQPLKTPEQCKTLDKLMGFQSYNISSPNNGEFIVYVNLTHLFHLSFDAQIRVGIPGELGYKCTFFHDDQNPKLIEYAFPKGSIIPKQEYFICVDNLETREDNCETHRYTLKKNPEVIDLRLRDG